MVTGEMSREDLIKVMEEETMGVSPMRMEEGKAMEQSERRVGQRSEGEQLRWKDVQSR